jgi:hypothetical protein
MKAVHIGFGIVTIALNGGAGVFGAWLWWRYIPDSPAAPWFWRALRAGQAALVIQAALGGVLVLDGHKPPSLHLIYALVPLGISFVAEQLRIASAEMVLDARGFESAQDVGRLPAEEQRAIVRAILHRELGVMALSALVNLVLLARAAGTG